MKTKVHMRDVAGRLPLTIELRGLRQYKLRMWIGGILLWVLAKVIWHPIAIEEGRRVLVSTHFPGERVMVDVEQLRALLDQIEQEAAEAESAKAALADAQAAALQAATDAQTASETYMRENDESRAKILETIALLQAAVEDD